MEFPKIKAAPRKKWAIGLRDATEEQIQKYIKTLKSYGCKVRHKTHKKYGKRLPYNGILQINYKD